ncbi:hypothetical protein [Bradyrhizobium glycinis]|uniref:hypothetical protein n=1 Tax=Bradyrhizobium glycinis TaxID=2751812 RepID=UPI0018D746E4|nr:hypothetical protein [Bradyrhizobium glycinis]MBH5368134.1 hypothetical protein [Bradyrhizobium glycinis]
MIQILSINAKTLVETLFARICAPRVNRLLPAAGHETGGVRIAEAAFEPGNMEVFAFPRFTAR